MSHIQLAPGVPGIGSPVMPDAWLFATDPTRRRPGEANATEDPPRKHMLAAVKAANTSADAVCGASVGS